MLRHNNQATNPEKLKPKMLATPERRPIAASWPMVANENFLLVPPRSVAPMLWATTRAWRSACCAVGGKNLPLRSSGMSAQSPSAQTLGQPGTASVESTQMRPRSRWHGSDASCGLADVPAVQITILERRKVPSLKVTGVSDDGVTLTFTRIST